MISDELLRLSFVRTVHPRVALSMRGTDSAALGATTLVLDSQLTPHQMSSRLTQAR